MVKIVQEGGKDNGTQKSNASKMLKDEDKKAGGTTLSKTIGWLNKNGGLQDKIAYSEVIEPLSGLGQQRAEQLLAELAEQSWTIQNPTKWLLKAVQNGGKGRGGKGKGFSKGSGKGSLEAALLGEMLGLNSWDTWGSSVGGGWAAPQENSKWVSKAIGQANASGKLKEAINWNECIGLLSAVPEAIAIDLVKTLESKGGEVEKPTQWLQSAARKYAKSDKKWKPGSGLSKMIGELNNSKTLQQEVTWRDVSGPLTLMDEADATELIKELAEKAAEIKNPTAWLASAAGKAAKRQDGSRKKSAVEE